MNETKDEKSSAATVALNVGQEGLYFWVRSKIDLDASAALSVRRLFSRMRIDTASVCAVSRLVCRALREAENDSAYIVGGMKRLAVEHRADREQASQSE